MQRNMILTDRQTRQTALDGIKGIAIFAVVSYHLGFFKYGYLGVDLFLVINGFLITLSINKGIRENKFSYISFLMRRIIRLCPLVLIATLVCLLIGYVGMLPDDYENLCETIVATNLFSNNILSGITTKNYWDVVNEYKPLMHTWYLGILAEFYIIYPLILMMVKKISCRYHLEYEKIARKVLLTITMVFFLLYVIPMASQGDKFYFLPYRFFELGIGGLMAFSKDRALQLKNQALVLNISLGILVVILISNINPLPDSICLMVAVLMSAILILTTISIKEHLILCNPIMVFLGKRSYSIFIWHQIILAFYRYFISNNVTVLTVLLYLLIVIAISMLSYRYIENVFTPTGKSIILLAAFGLVVTIPAGLIFLNAGVVRDVPELDVTLQNAHRNMHAEYNDRIYDMRIS